MKKIYLICFLLLTSDYAITQEPMHSTTPKPSTYRRVRNCLSLGLPMVGIDYVTDLKKNQLLLPGGLGDYRYRSQSFGWIIAFPIYSSGRILGLYYKERLGVELYYGYYMKNVDQDNFSANLTKAFPNYYIPSQNYPSGFGSQINYFDGLLYGITYKIPLRKSKRFLVEPKLLFAFGSGGDAYINDYVFKEKNVNGYMRYEIKNELVPNNYFSYHAQLNFVYRYNGQSAILKGEVGIKTEYCHIPYRTRLTLSSQPYGMSATTQQAEAKFVAQTLGVGIYYTVYITPKHPVKQHKYFSQPVNN